MMVFNLKLVQTGLFNTMFSNVVYFLFSLSPEQYPKEFSDLFHALDVWHKSVKLSKKLNKVKTKIYSHD